MSAALKFTSKHSLISPPPPPPITVFAPSDEAFIFSGVPNPSLLRYHLLPVAFHLRSLKSLPFGTKVSTLLAGHSLTVTTLPGDRLVSLNNVTASPIFDDGSLVIFGIPTHFNPYFQLSPPIQNPNAAAAETAAHYIAEASTALKSKASSTMATFVEIQFVEFLVYHASLTFSRHVGFVTVNRIGGLSRYSSFLNRHVAPCNDLAKLEMNMSRYGGDLVLNGVTVIMPEINISRYGSVLVLHGVTVTMPEMCRNDWLMVPGVSEVLLQLPGSPTPMPVQSAIQWLFRLVIWLWDALLDTAPGRLLLERLHHMQNMSFLEWMAVFCLLLCFRALESWWNAH
ncbi:putative fasciclin-like arabinogalactan protein 20 [Argentina anserina]|uniref:putative fasciclin-like arabinogalactan protein 20 n=1 Tax=Argentina anserina TaxID=57926 RepID=UPI0021765B43|nr:putative fasciclin-like arabinogalactan protein 20 [Potentilla anserina]